MTDKSENPNNNTHDRLDDITTSFLDMSYEERMQRVKEIRQGRVMPSAKKAVKPKVAKSRETKLATAIENMTPEDIALLKARLQKRKDSK